MSEWCSYQFSELCDITRGASPRPIHDYIADEGMPWVKIADATSSDSRFIERTKERIKTEGVPKSVAVYPGDLILSNSATPGLPKFMKIDACIHDGWMLLRNFRNLDKRFAYWLLLHERKNLVMQATGSVFTNLKTDIMKNHRIKIPDELKQRGIADILDGIAEKLELNHQTNQTLEQIAQAIFKSWFVDFEPVKAKLHLRALGGNEEQTERAAQTVIAGAVNLDVITTATDLNALDQQLNEALSKKLAHQTDAQRKKLATTASHFPNQLVESELGLIPEGWEVSSFSEIANNIRDSVHPSTIESNIPYVGLEHIEKKKIYLANWGHAGDVDSNKVRFLKGDYLFGKLRPYFHKVCLPPVEGTCSTDILVIRAMQDDWQGFVQCQLFDPVFVEYANARCTGTRMPRASWRDMGEYGLAKPSTKITHVFNGIIRVFNELAAENIWSCKSLVSLRDSVLPKLLSGDLNVGHLSDPDVATNG